MTKGTVLMIKLEPLSKKHINDILEIEKSCFAIPWSRASMENELKNNMAVYVAAVEDGRVAGYGGMWHIVNEGHITNIAVREDCRRRGIATMIINRMLEIAEEKEMIGITLEVRMSNTAAKSLYTKLGFKLEGIRPEYYEDNREDALIMWKYLIDEGLVEQHK